MPKIMISAAEVSGDVHGSYLVREIKKMDPSMSFFGMGGEQLRAAGADIRIDITSKSTIGILEALKHVPSHLNTINKLKKMMDHEKPEALILIDAQGFNMPMASIARSKGIRTIYYIAPQEWLWGTEKGVRKVASTIDMIVSIFKKEHEAYQKAGGNSVYFGHPLIDIAKKSIARSEFMNKYRIEPDNKIISLCPGSRYQEIKGFLPMLIETARKIKKDLQDVKFILPLSSTIFKDEIIKLVNDRGVDILIIEKDNYNALGNSDLAIAVSGTVVLESALLGTPVIMFYKLSELTYFIAKNVLKIKLPYYSMPNILLNEPAVPEYVMKEANAENLYKKAIELLSDNNKTDQIKDKFKKLKLQLGDPGMINKAAGSIVRYLSA